VNNYEYALRLFSLYPGTYIFNAQATNDQGTSPWSDDYFVYSSYNTGNGVTIESSNTGMPNNWDLQYTDGADMAFKVFVPAQSQLTFSCQYPETNFQNKMEIFNADGSSTGHYNYGGLSGAQISNVSLESGYYYVVVDGINGQTGNFKLTIMDNSTLTAPFTQSGNNVGASNGWDVNGSDGADLAYKFYMPQNGNLSVSTCFPNTDFDTKIEVFDANLQRTGLYNDDDHSCSYIRASTYNDFYLTEGYYYLVVDGYGGATGNFDVEVSLGSTSKSAQVSKNKFVLLADDEDLGKYEKGASIGYAVKVFPNPASHQFQVSFTENNSAILSLIDMTGRVVKNVSSQALNIQVDCSELPSGVYNLRIENGNAITNEKIQLLK